LTIFGTNIPDTTGRFETVKRLFKVPLHPTSVSTLPEEIRTNEILHFLQGSIITLLK